MDMPYRHPVIVLLAALALLTPGHSLIAQPAADADKDNPAPKEAELPELDDLSNNELVKLLDHDAFEVREHAQQHLLSDDSIDLDAVLKMMEAATSDEQRFRLVRIARHHVLRDIRLKNFKDDDVFNRRDKAAIGFTYAPLLAADNPFTDHPGATILSTMPGFPGYEHLRVGDILISVDGQTIRDTASEPNIQQWIAWWIGVHQPGDRIRLTVIRQGKVINLNVTCASQSALTTIYKDNTATDFPLNEPYNTVWQKALAALQEKMPKPKTLTPKP